MFMISSAGLIVEHYNHVLVVMYWQNTNIGNFYFEQVKPTIKSK